MLTAEMAILRWRRGMAMRAVMSRLTLLAVVAVIVLGAIAWKVPSIGLWIAVIVMVIVLGGASLSFWYADKYPLEDRPRVESPDRPIHPGAVPMSRPWSCDKCNAQGLLQYLSNDDALTCWNAIAKLHAAASPDCHAKHGDDHIKTLDPPKELEE